MTKLLFFLLSVSTVLPLFGQIGLISKSKLHNIKDKKLIVVLKNEQLQTKNADEEELDLKFNIEYNKAIKEEIKKYWKLSNGVILFLNEIMIDDMSQSEINNALFLSSGWSIKTNEIQGEFLMYSFNIQEYNKNGKKSTIFDFSYVPDDFISNADIIFFSKVLNNHIDASNSIKKYKDYFDINNNIETIESKILLLDENISNLSPEKAKKVYKKSIKIETAANIAQQIISESEEYLFIRLIWSNSRKAALYNAFDTKNCHIISCIGTGGLRVSIGTLEGKYFGPGGTSNFYHNQKYPYTNTSSSRQGISFDIYKSDIKIKKAHLKTMFSKLAQKVNCR